jgi:hypothetical protein
VSEDLANQINIPLNAGSVCNFKRETFLDWVGKQRKPGRKWQEEARQEYRWLLRGEKEYPEGEAKPLGKRDWGGAEEPESA